MDACRIAVVDDTAPQRLLVSRILGKAHTVQAYASGEAFLGEAPDVELIILDIEMPGLSGYDVCRQLRSSEQYANTPVIFFSAHDTAPERLAAYEAGGDDFLIKPVVADELNHKVNSLLNQRATLNALQSSSSAAQQMAFSVMSNMGELGVLIDFMRRVISCSSIEQIASCVTEALNNWGLRGLVQVRDRQQAINLSTDEASCPLQESVLATMRTMGRIFEMKSRAVVNFDRVSILVQNLPTENPELVGRLRDHLAMLGELADNGVQHLTSRAELKFFGDAIRDLQITLQRTAARDAENRGRMHQHTTDVLDSLERSIISMGVTSVQRDYLGDLIRDSRDELTAAFDEASTIHADFSDAMEQLQAISETYSPRGAS